MPRIIEIVLFLTPFLGFAAWRLISPSPRLPLWLLSSLAGLLVVILFSLLWLRHMDAGDANQTYVPAQLREGQIMPTQRLPRP